MTNNYCIKIIKEGAFCAFFLFVKMKGIL